MPKKRARRQRMIAAVLAAALFGGAAALLPASAAGMVCTINATGEQLPIAPQAVKTIQMEQSTVMDITMQSASASRIYATNDSGTISVPKPYANGSAVYTIYARGAVGSSFDVYANDGSDTKLFNVKVCDRPFVSDTTMDFQVQVGKSYTFRITPNDPKAYVTFNTSDGSVFSTLVANKEVSASRADYYFRVTALKPGSVGVYVTVGDTQYRVFTVDAVDVNGAGTPPSVPTVDPDAPGTPGVVKVSSSLNLRAGPGTSYSAIGTLQNGESVTILKDMGNGWLQVRTPSGQVGYCSGEYISTDIDPEEPETPQAPEEPESPETPTSGTATVQVSSGSLNVRSGPGTSYSAVGSLQNGDTVTVLETADGWAKVETASGLSGYCSAEYLVFGGGASSSDGSTITLNVPKYMQTDDRWGDVWIGGAGGGSIRSIGCTLTCIAMTESYCTGEALTPDVMAERIEFTSAGLLYWPEGYASLSNATDENLSFLYEKLKAGIPVIVGGANSQTTHYVVVTCCKGVTLDEDGNPESLDASQFTVHDPGYSSVKTLQDFIEKFPSNRSYRSY